MNENQQVSLTKEVTQEATTFWKDVTTGSKALREKVFGDLSDKNVYGAIIEGLARGYTPQDFLAKKIYAIPFNDRAKGPTYSLVMSIEDARAKAAETGKYAGSSAPQFKYKEDGTAIESCSMTVKKIVMGNICDFTAEVYFDEYDGKRNLWTSKPRTMIAKVAEMHALRKAFPDIVKLYDESELEKANIKMFQPQPQESVTISVGEEITVEKVDESQEQLKEEVEAIVYAEPESN